MRLFEVVWPDLTYTHLTLPHLTSPYLIPFLTSLRLTSPYVTMPEHVIGQGLDLYAKNKSSCHSVNHFICMLLFLFYCGSLSPLLVFVPLLVFDDVLWPSWCLYCIFCLVFKLSGTSTIKYNSLVYIIPRVKC